MAETTRVVGLIAAAGESVRMGQPKALLPFPRAAAGAGLWTFLDQLLEVFHDAGIADVIVTVPDDSEQARAVGAVAQAAGARCSNNRYPAQGLAGSVRTAIEIIEAADVAAGGATKDAPGRTKALLICPVDAPFATSGLVTQLVAELVQGAPAVVPVVGDRPGHPVGFSRTNFLALQRAASARGPRSVLEALGDTLIEVPSDDERLVANINTPAIYEEVFGIPPS